jgi:hypothetical protein
MCTFLVWFAVFKNCARDDDLDKVLSSSVRFALQSASSRVVRTSSSSMMWVGCWAADVVGLTSAQPCGGM